jgi:uroporphyrinogen-III synthase
MRVWITRSQPGAERQASALRQRGYRVFVGPVLEIEPLPVPPPGPFERVIFLSEHAVRHGLDQLDLRGAEVFAVGGRTAERLESAGLAVKVPQIATSEGLLAMAELASVAGSRILIVCGEGGREVLAAELIRRGASVARLVCYRRRPAAGLDVDVAVIDAIVAASGDGLEQIARLWFGAGGSAGVALLVPSARVAARAKALGFARVRDCGGADVAAVLRQLDALGSTGVR